jgi:predicted Zn-dependent protease with MMP-like domain
VPSTREIMTARPMKKPGHERLWNRLLTEAEAEVGSLITTLPAPVRKHAMKVPVTYEPFPNEAIVGDGFDPDLLGLFVGNSINASVESEETIPAQIILFLESIWDFAGHDAEVYREEIRCTYLHELGHYLGLDENGMIERDLD